MINLIVLVTLKETFHSVILSLFLIQHASTIHNVDCNIYKI
ncbi:hypothetical protein HMPREF9431_01892 [Segatella oulorum F0390]|uniref:Uncharacterized protein n=1 Tax=Segatella oulorum F0390 TaxID=702438 RepID=G1WDK0_9BACT|nr:hypothetical protein HMPREF9431_01892 [Segatella oulorum F0390]